MTPFHTQVDGGATFLKRREFSGLRIFTVQEMEEYERLKKQGQEDLFWEGWKVAKWAIGFRKEQV